MMLRTLHALLDDLIRARDAAELAAFVKWAKALELEGRERDLVNEFYLARKAEMGL